MGCGWRLFQAAIYVIGAAAVLFGLLLVAALGIQVLDTVQLDRHHAVTDAVVVSVDPGSRYPDVLHIRYRTAAGQTFTTTVNSPEHGAYSPGDSFPLEYDPGKPTRIRRAGSHDALALAGLVVVVVVAAGGGWVGVRRRRGG